jgi:hypothetical protein
MKMRPLLPETDLARIAPLPHDQKRKALEQLRFGRPPYSYAPVRNCISDILNIQAPLFGSLPRTPLAKIAQTIVAQARTSDEAIANLYVAEGLYNYATDHGLHGRSHEFLPMSIGVSEKVVFWHSLILVVAGRSIVPFFDPRRQTKRLTEEARRFVFSMMHERIRVPDPDFANIGLGIYQFSTGDTGPRAPILYTDEAVVLFTFDELDEMIRETYALWDQVCGERTERTRRTSGGAGSML